MTLPLLAVSCGCLPDTSELACSVLDKLDGVYEKILEQNTILEVKLDYTQVMKLDITPGTVILGNPAIVGVDFVDDRTLILSGRAPGITNLILMDDMGEMVMNREIRVTAPVQGLVTVYKGTSPQIFVCSDGCTLLEGPTATPQPAPAASGDGGADEAGESGEASAGDSSDGQGAAN